MKYAVFGILDGEERIIIVRATSKQKLNEFLRDRFGGEFIVEYINTLGH